jgi:post-segregation antitoxin (ccd killing protein)
MNKQRKQSMRQTVDEHSPTYERARARTLAVSAVEAIGTMALQAASRVAPKDKPVFVRGARVKSNSAT